MTYPNFYYEQQLWKKGFKYVVGVDDPTKSSHSPLGTIRTRLVGRLGGVNYE